MIVNIVDITDKTIDFSIDSKMDLAEKVASDVCEKYNTSISHWQGTANKITAYLNSPIITDMVNQVMTFAQETAETVNKQADRYSVKITEAPNTDPEMQAVYIPKRMYIDQTIRVKTHDGNWYILKRIE